MKLNVNKFIAGMTFLFLVSGVLFLNSCKKPTYYKLTDEDMSWLVVDDNEVLKFTNGTDIQTFRVTLRQRYYDVDGDTYAERTGALLRQENDTTAYPSDSNGELYIAKYESSTLVTLTWPHFPIPSSPINNLPQQIVSIGGIVYTDVIILDGTLLTDFRRYVDKVWFSKTYGVLQYTDIYGNTWVRNI